MSKTDDAYIDKMNSTKLKKYLRDANRGAELNSKVNALLIEEQDALRARIAELELEMKRYLPILESVFSDGNALHHHGWGTGLETLNSYRAALAKQEGE